jgi:hypothetical protein
MKNALRRVTLIGLVLATTFMMVRAARDMLLRETDCIECRRIYSLVLRPSDFNTPIAVGWFNNGATRFAILPRYVGLHFLALYGGAEIDPGRVSLSCAQDIRFTPSDGGLDSNRLSSKFGAGVIVGTVYIAPEQVTAESPIECRLESSNDQGSFEIVISRASVL